MGSVTRDIEVTVIVREDGVVVSQEKATSRMPIAAVGSIAYVEAAVCAAIRAIWGSA